MFNYSDSDLALGLREEVPDASESIYQVYAVAIWFGFSGKIGNIQDLDSVRLIPAGIEASLAEPLR